MKIKQFKDNPLAHFSYALVSNGEMALIDPTRNPLQYYQYAEEENATIVAVFETHPHADFISGHLQIHMETGATVYISKEVGVEYPHQPLEKGDKVNIGKVEIRALHTPGHSPDSLSFYAEETDKKVLFTGDTLFIGDVGRPDLRENNGKMTAKRRELAAMMYDTIRNAFKNLPDDTIIYPAHGAGSLCGKNMSDANSSTLGNERIGNWSFREQTREDFIEEILKDQPFIPAYFGFNVDLNRMGAENVQLSKYRVPFKITSGEWKPDHLIVDTRAEGKFKQSHLPNSINIMARSEEDIFETWLGAILAPNEEFYLVIESIDKLDEILERTAKIGYEKQVKAVLTLSSMAKVSSGDVDFEDFRNHPEKYTIVDIRNKSEVVSGKIFGSAYHIPLNELRYRAEELPRDKPLVVHCAGGYRSAAGSSILENSIPERAVYDLKERIKEFH